MFQAFCFGMSIRTITGRVPSGQEMTMVSSFSDRMQPGWLIAAQMVAHNRGQNPAGQQSPALKRNSSPLLNN